jgi:hypothetical protein
MRTGLTHSAWKATGAALTGPKIARDAARIAIDVERRNLPVCVVVDAKRGVVAVVDAGRERAAPARADLHGVGRIRSTVRGAAAGAEQKDENNA